MQTYTIRIPDTKAKVEPLDDLKRDIMAHARWLRETYCLPLADAIDQAKQEFHYEDYFPASPPSHNRNTIP